MKHRRANQRIYRLIPRCLAFLIESPQIRLDPEVKKASNELHKRVNALEDLVLKLRTGGHRDGNAGA